MGTKLKNASGCLSAFNNVNKFDKQIEEECKIQYDYFFPNLSKLHFFVNFPTKIVQLLLF